MNLIYLDNELTADDFILFQRKMGWPEENSMVLEKSLSNTIYSIVAKKDDEIIGMGRLLGDAALYWYLQDVFILPAYQHQGIGSEIVSRLLQYVKTSSIPNTTASVYLMSSKGKEGFYERFGFKRRPHEQDGAGMELDIKIF